MLDGPLSDSCHDTRIDGRTDDAQDIEGDHDRDNPHQSLIDGVQSVGDARQDDVVDQLCHESIDDDIGYGGKDDADQDDDKMDRVSFKDVAKQTLEGFHIDLFIRDISCWSRWHLSFPPFLWSGNRRFLCRSLPVS